MIALVKAALPAEVEKWLAKISTLRGYYAAQPQFRESEHRFEILGGYLLGCA